MRPAPFSLLSCSRGLWRASTLRSRRRVEGAHAARLVIQLDAATSSKQPWQVLARIQRQGQLAPPCALGIIRDDELTVAQDRLTMDAYGPTK